MGYKSVETVAAMVVVLLINGCGNKLENKSEKMVVPLTAEQQLVQNPSRVRKTQCPECVG